MPALLALLAVILLVSCPCPAAADAQDAAVSKVFRKTWEKFSDVSAEAVELAALRYTGHAVARHVAPDTGFFGDTILNDIGYFV